MEQTRTKIALFLGLFFFLMLCGLFFEFKGLNWITHTSLTHTLVQSIATVISLFVGVAALYHFYSKEAANYMLLFMGVGFIGTFIIDAYHTIATTAWFTNKFPRIPSSVIEGSWLSTRVFLSTLMLLGAIRFLRKEKTAVVSTTPIYISVSILTALILVIFISIPIHLPMYPENLIARPLELIPGVLFLITLIIYLANGEWKTDQLQFWIVLFLITSVATQFFFIDLSKHAHDALYIGAHVLKIISYGMVYVGVTAEE